MSKDLFNGNAGDRSDDTAWELRPGGMAVQRRDGAIVDNNGPILRVKVSFGNSQHEVSVPAHATFGDLKTLLAQVTGLEPQDQRILFRGKEKESDEYLHIAGVQDSAKLILLEDPASKERKMEGMKMNPNVSKACEAIAAVRAEVDKLSGQVAAIESAVNNGTKVEEKKIIVLTEMLMIQLLKLDGIEAEGEAKALRKVEVRRIQNYVELMDSLKARNSKPFSDNGTSITTKWETFNSGMGSLNAPPAANITQDWEVFE